MFFAKPDTHLFMEDIVLRFSLEQLQEIFYKTMQFIRERSLENKWPPLYDNL